MAGIALGFSSAIAMGKIIARTLGASVTRTLIAKDVANKLSIAALADRVGGPAAHAANMASMAQVLEMLVNYGKQNGPWNNVTHNLRNVGYFWEIVEPQKGVIEGYFGNTMDYAVYVEFKPGLWVLSGAVNALKPQIDAVFGEGTTISPILGGPNTRTRKKGKKRRSG